MTALTTVVGYDKGVAYTVQIGGEGRTTIPHAGLVTYAAPTRVLAYVDAMDGQQVSLTPESDTITATFDTTEGVVAALIDQTEVISVTGYVPDGIVTFNVDEVDVVH